MNKATLVSKLKFVGDKNPGLELYLLFRKTQDDAIEILRADLEESGAKARLQSVFINKIKSQLLNQDNEGKSIEGFQDWNLKPISEVDDIKNTYYYFPNTPPNDENEDDYHIPEEFEEMTKLAGLEYEKTSKFEFDKHLLDHVFAYLIRIQIDKEQVILYKHKYPIDLLSRTTVLKVLGMEMNHGTRFSLEKEPLLKVTDKFDFMLMGSHFVILNLALLESRYGFNERYLKKGAESLEFIRKKKILFDTKIFDEQVKRVSFSKKLMKVKADNEVLKRPVAEIKTFLEDYKTKDGKFSLAKRIKYLPTKGKFDVKSIVAAEDFIRLLNDQFLYSQLTKRPYVSDVHEEFKGEEGKSVPEKEQRKKRRAKPVTT